MNVHSVVIDGSQEVETIQISTQLVDATKKQKTGVAILYSFLLPNSIPNYWYKPSSNETYVSMDISTQNLERRCPQCPFVFLKNI